MSPSPVRKPRQIRMDDREMARIEKAARQIGERGWSTWARRVLLQLADEILARGVR